MYSATDTLAQSWERAMRAGHFAAAHAIAAVIRRTPCPDPCCTPRHHQRIWDGRPIDGRVVLVRCYHGLGDTIQFARFLPRLAARTARLHVWAQAPLIPLLRSMRAAIDWYPLHDGDFPHAYDVDLEIMELAQLFGTTLSDLPMALPYLHVSAAGKRSAPGGSRRHVGLVWRAGPWAPHRSIPYGMLRTLRALPHVQWHALQQGEHPDAIIKTAQFIRGLDLVVSVDSMVAHLAGALGVPVWTLLSATADWRWMEGRSDSPWYPTMQLIRQPVLGDWEAVVQEVVQRLRIGSE